MLRYRLRSVCVVPSSWIFNIHVETCFFLFYLDKKSATSYTLSKIKYNPNVSNLINAFLCDIWSTEQSNWNIAESGVKHHNPNSVVLNNLRSASANTTLGLLPPSSNVTRFKLVFAAAPITICPTYKNEYGDNFKLKYEIYQLYTYFIFRLLFFFRRNLIIHPNFTISKPDMMFLWILFVLLNSW